MRKTISIAELSKNAERIAKDIETAGTVYRIRRPGHRPMLLIDQQQLESRITTAELMARHPNWEQEIEDDWREIREGRGVTLEAFLAQRGLADLSPALERAQAVRRPARTRRSKQHRS